MAKFISLMLLVLLFLASTITPACAAPKRHPPRKQATPPPPAGPATPVHYILAVQWGYTVCGGRPVCASFNIQPEFTIHGLWPDPQPKVAIGAAFTNIDLKPILNQLKIDWLDAEHNDESLWRHEYKDHGIFFCRYSRQYMDSGLKAYNAVKKFNLGSKVFQAFGGGSTQFVSETDLNTRLQIAIENHTLGLVCDFTGQYPKLKELRIYLKVENNRFVVDDLPNSLMPSSAVKCPSGADLTLPLA